jgi:thioredoxin 1
MATQNLTDKTFEATVNKKGIVLIDWWAEWCGPCKAFGPVYEKVSNTHPDVVFGKVDTEDQPGLAAAFEVRAIPTLSILRDGVLLFHKAGMLPAKALEDLIRQTGELDMEKVKAEIAAQQAGTATAGSGAA